MVKLTRGDALRLIVLAIWAASWTDIWKRSVEQLSSEPWVAFSALATFLAAAVALWAATIDIRLRANERRRIATTYMAMFEADIGSMAAALRDAKGWFTVVSKSDVGTPLNAGDPMYLREIARIVKAEMMTSHLSALPAFDEKVACGLARLAGSGAMLASRLQVIADERYVTEPLRKVAGSIIEQIEMMQSEIVGTGLIAEDRVMKRSP